jgi:HPt (histidine-containing phosphotransfer) domain-containing protein
MDDDRTRIKDTNDPSWEGEPVLDMPMLENRFSGKDDLLATVASEYRSFVRRAADELKNVLDNGDMQSLRQQTHTFKGNAALVGAKRTESLARAAEHAAMQQDPETARNKVFELLEAAEESVRKLEELLRSRGSQEKL